MKFSKVHKHENGLYYVMKSSNRIFTEIGYRTRLLAMQGCVSKSIEWYCKQAEELIEKNNLGLMKEDGEFWNVNKSVSKLKFAIENIHSQHDNYNENDPCTWC